MTEGPEGPDDALVPEEAARLFREGLVRLGSGEVREALPLLEESATLEGGEGEAVARAQIVRMLVVRGMLDQALLALERSSHRTPEVYWRTLEDMLEPLVTAGRSTEAVHCLLAAAASVGRSPDFTAAFSSVFSVFQTLGVSEEVHGLVLASLREAAAERLDALLAVERLAAARDYEEGRSDGAIARLASVMHRALERRDRRTEEAALLTIFGLAFGVERELVSDAFAAEPEHPLHEMASVERLAILLGDEAKGAAAGLTAAAKLAREREDKGAAASLERVAVVLFARAGAVSAAKEALGHALALGEELGGLARGEGRTVEAWLGGIAPEPAQGDPADAEALDPSSPPKAPAPRAVLAPPAEGADPEAPAALQVGGDPSLPEGLRWPRCLGCGDPLTYVGELAWPAAPLSPFTRAQVFACNVAPWTDTYESRCDAASRPGVGGALVVLRQRLDAARGDDEPGSGSEADPRESTPTPEGGAPRLAPSGAPLLQEMRLVARPEGAAAKGYAEARASLGGELPADIGPIRCGRCEGPLRLVARLGGRVEPVVQIMDGGFLYVLMCEAGCSDRGVAFWQPGSPLVAD